MRIIRRTDQGGSVTVFVLVGIILAIGLIVSIYLIKQRGEQARRDQAIAIYEKEQVEKEKAESEKKPIITPETPVKTNEISLSDLSDYDWTSVLPETGSKIDYLELFRAFSLTASIVGYLISKKELMRSL